MADHEKQSAAQGPLAGLRILDLTRVLAGPWASQLLADYGADVIKVERPGCGDDTRSWGPPWLPDDKGGATSDSAYFLSSNRNKRSITANIAHPEGRQIVESLAAQSDVLMENFRVGTMRRYGLNFEHLQELNPAIILCSISAYGQTGSRADKPGYDAMVQASGGLMSVTGQPDDEGGSPVKVGVAIADIMAGMYATTAILAALVARDQSGEGQHIDVPLYDSQVAWLANQNMNWLVGDEIPGRLGTAHPNLVPYQAFATSDGHLMLAIGNERQYRSAVTAMGLASLADDERFNSNADRVRNRGDLVALLQSRMRERTAEEWLNAFAAAEVPAGPINSIAEIFSEPYAAERGLVRSVTHATAGETPTVVNPVRFSSTPVEYRHAPPILGEHTSEVLSGDLGMSEADIRRLAAAGAI